MHDCSPHVGLLSAVGSLNITTLDSTLTLTWTPPFTLDIEAVESDISGYCVDVVNSTSSSTLHSECGITETQFSYPIPPDSDCYVYNFTVTPVNIVGNGTSEIVTYMGAGISKGSMFYAWQIIVFFHC